MAAFIVRHATSRQRIFTSNLIQRYRGREFSTKQPAKIESAPPLEKLKSFEQSLSSRGFLRPQKAYQPPINVKGKLEDILKTLSSSPQSWDAKIEDPLFRFNLLNACCKEFNHGIPNSMLYLIETIGDVFEFYSTPVDVRTPLDAMKNMELPPNLHVQYEYHRFHPDTDTMFGGVSAYPKSSTIVTGLKYKKKYPGYEAKKSWP